MQTVHVNQDQQPPSRKPSFTRTEIQAASALICQTIASLIVHTPWVPVALAIVCVVAIYQLRKPAAKATLLGRTIRYSAVLVMVLSVVEVFLAVGGLTLLLGALLVAFLVAPFAEIHYSKAIVFVTERDWHPNFSFNTGVAIGSILLALMAIFVQLPAWIISAVVVAFAALLLKRPAPIARTVQEDDEEIDLGFLSGDEEVDLTFALTNEEPEPGDFTANSNPDESENAQN